MSLDVLIVGGGLTGCALALALRDSGLQVGLLERRLPVVPPAGFEERHLGLAEASVASLQQLGVGAALQTAAGAIRSVHVSSQGELGHCVLDAAEHGVARLGITCPARALGTTLETALHTLPNLTLIRPAELLEARAEADALSVTLTTEGGPRTLRTRLLVGADGADSRVRQLAGIAAMVEDSGQVALVSNMAVERPHQDRAYERFTRTGPLAVLPLPGPGHRCGVVWTLPAADAQARMRWADAPYREGLQAAFGHRLGRIERLGPRQPHPLVRVLSAHTTAPRIALIGNAAQTLHPIGAQGFNLGLRDALGLATAIRSGGSDAGHSTVLAAYADGRGPDRVRTRGFSEGLLAWTVPPALAPARTLGLLGLDLLKPLRARMVRFGMGYGRA